MFVTCKFKDCRYKWDYNGKRKKRACCPDCGRQMSLCGECTYGYRNGKLMIKNKCTNCKQIKEE